MFTGPQHLPHFFPSQPGILTTPGPSGAQSAGKTAAPSIRALSSSHPSSRCGHLALESEQGPVLRMPLSCGDPG